MLLPGREYWRNRHTGWSHGTFVGPGVEFSDTGPRGGSVRARAKDAGMSNSVDTFEPGCSQNLAR